MHSTLPTPPGASPNASSHHALAQPQPAAPTRRGRPRTAAHGGRLPRRGIRAAAAGGDSGGGDEKDVREAARQLNALFFAPSAPESHDDGNAQPEAQGAADAPQPLGPQQMADLPLWRVQWTALPGNLEVLHVHVPHYCALFERLFREKRPWRYGHLYLPEGSKNLGAPEFALSPGTQAPLAGTLMELLEAVRFGDGRLLLLAVGVGRFRVTRPTQDLPYCRADVEALADAEEQQAFEGLALAAADAVHGGLQGGEPAVGALMAAVPAAARAAAAAWARAWAEYELSGSRREAAGGDGEPAVIDGSRGGEAQSLGRRLAAIAGNEVLPLPFYEALAGPTGTTATEWEAEDGRSALRQALDTQRGVLRSVEAGAYAAASAAAADAVARCLVEQSPTGGVAAAGASLQAPPPALNSAAERGVVWQAPDEILEPEESLSGEPDSLAVALQLEEAVWAEIAAVHGLASKLRDRAAPLPDGLRCLRPWRPEESLAGVAAGGESGAPDTQPGAHPDYPPLRRVQRLSFALTALLANVSAAEGRQAWVEAGSVCARLRLGLAALRKHRQVLAAVVAVEGL